MFKKINCKYYRKGLCRYIPKYLDESMKVEKICEYILLKKEDRKHLVKKCAARNLIKKLEIQDKELRKKSQKTKKNITFKYLTR